MVMSSNHYTVLELTPDASYDQITKACRRLRPLYERDPVRRNQIDEAWRVLSTPITRKQYDESLRAGTTSSSLAPATARQDLQPAAARPRAFRGRTEVVEVAPPVAEPQRKRRRTTDVIENGGPPPPKRAGHHRPPRTVTDVVEVGEETVVPLGQEVRDSRPARLVPSVEAVGQDDQVAASTPEAPRQIPRAELHLTFQGMVQVFPLQKHRCVIGRPSKNGPHPDIPLPDPSAYISRTHAVVFFEDGKWLLVDDRSPNGTSLNGTRLTPAYSYPLKHGDVIEIESRRLAFQLE